MSASKTASKAHQKDKRREAIGAKPQDKKKNRVKEVTKMTVKKGGVKIKVELKKKEEYNFGWTEDFEAAIREMQAALELKKRGGAAAAPREDKKEQKKEKKEKVCIERQWAEGPESDGRPVTACSGKVGSCSICGNHVCVLHGLQYRSISAGGCDPAIRKRPGTACCVCVDFNDFEGVPC